MRYSETFVMMQPYTKVTHLAFHTKDRRRFKNMRNLVIISVDIVENIGPSSERVFIQTNPVTYGFITRREQYKLLR